MIRVLILFLFMLQLSTAQQFTKNTIGLRLGASEGFGTEISYQRALTDKNRMEFNIGWRSADSYDGLRINALYQWVWSLQNNINWYYGGGVGFSNFNFEEGGNEFAPGILGSIGVEYNFDFPVLISLDLRPSLNISDNIDALNLDIGFGVRYQFDW